MEAIGTPINFCVTYSTMQSVLAAVSPISSSAVVMISVAALPPAKIGALAMAMSRPMTGIPITIIAATAPQTQHTEVTTTFH